MNSDGPKPHDQLFLERQNQSNVLSLVHKALVDEMSSFRVKQNMLQLKACCPFDISTIPDSQLTQITEYFLTTLNKKINRPKVSRATQCNLLEELMEEEDLQPFVDASSKKKRGNKLSTLTLNGITRIKPKFMIDQVIESNESFDSITDSEA